MHRDGAWRGMCFLSLCVPGLLLSMGRLLIGGKGLLLFVYCQCHCLIIDCSFHRSAFCSCQAISLGSSKARWAWLWVFGTRGICCRPLADVLCNMHCSMCSITKDTRLGS